MIFSLDLAQKRIWHHARSGRHLYRLPRSRSGRSMNAVAGQRIHRSWAAAVTLGVLLLLGALLHMFAVLPLSWSEVHIDKIEAEPGSSAYFSPIEAPGQGQIWRSSYRLRENGMLLKPRTDIVDAVRAHGHGAWAYWRGGLWFSASDGTDPRSNGRSYVLERPSPIPIGLLVGIFLSTLGLLILASPGSSVWDRAGALTGLRSPPISAFACSVVLIILLQPHLYLLYEGDQYPSPARWVLLIGLVAGASLIGQGAPKRLRVAMSILAAMFAFGLVFEAYAPQGNNGTTHMGSSILLWALSIMFAIFCGWATLHWTGFAAVPTCAYVWMQHYVRRHSLIIPNVDVDWTPIAENTIFLVTGLAAAALTFRALDWVLRSAPPGWGWLQSARLVKADRDKSLRAAVTGLVMLFIAAHMGNYFHSAVEKIALDGGPLSWVTANQTYYLATNGAALGTAPLQLSSSALAAWKTLNVPVNALTLSTQLAALLALLLPITVAPLTALFDVWHLGVFALSGIFFWKWMLLNAAIIVAWSGRTEPIGWRLRLLACALTALSPYFFGIIKLGWYDTPALNRIEVLAVDRNGARIPVPAAYFRAYSYAFVSTLSWGDETQGVLFPTDTWGSTKSVGVMRAMSDCQKWPTIHGSVEKLVHSRLADFIRATHVQRRAERVQYVSDGIYLYPHHVFSNPFSYQAFSHLRLDEIRSYVVVAQALCTDPDSLSTDVVQSVDVARVDIDAD